MHIIYFSEDATVIENSYIGAGTDMIKTTTFHYMDTHNNVYITVADDGCVPIMYESAGKNEKGGVVYILTIGILIVTHNYHNKIVEGLKNDIGFTFIEFFLQILLVCFCIGKKTVEVPVLRFLLNLCRSFL